MDIFAAHVDLDAIGSEELINHALRIDDGDP